MTRKKRQNINRTGIYYLAVELRTIYPIYAQMSMHDVIAHILPRWRSMPLTERKPYEDLAKEFKRIRLTTFDDILTSAIPSSEEALFIEKNIHEDHFLTSYFSRDLNDIFKNDFLFLTFQIFCRTDDEDGGKYYPAELAIMKYSFSESVKQEYFTIIKPEKFPIGYTGAAIDRSRETHQIPPFDFIGANDDYPRIWEEVKKVIGETHLDSSTNQPILLFCNAFERDQTTSILDWLIEKRNKSDRRSPKPSFHICSFEGLVVAILRRLNLGNFAHQSVREQLHRPVYTLQIKDRCVYHDSLAIQYCCRAINHGYSLFLDDFIRQRFIALLPDTNQHFTASSFKNETVLTSNESTISSNIDSIDSKYIQKQANGYSRLTEQRNIDDKKSPRTIADQLGTIGSNIFIQSSSANSSPLTNQSSFKAVRSKMKPPIQIDCRWPTSSIPNKSNEDADQYVMTGRGLRKLVKDSYTKSNSHCSNSIVGHGRGKTVTFSMSDLLD